MSELMIIFFISSAVLILLLCCFLNTQKTRANYVAKASSSSLAVVDRFVTPISMKNYLAQKAASIKLKIKLSRISNEMGKIIFLYHGRKFGDLIISDGAPKDFILKLESNNLEMCAKPIFFSSLSSLDKLKITDRLISYSSNFTNAICSKLDLGELQELSLWNLNIDDGYTFKSLLSPSLKIVCLNDCEIKNFDTPVEILKSCPFVYRLTVDWQTNITTLTSLNALPINQRLKLCRFNNIIPFPTILEVKNFIGIHMQDSGSLEMFIKGKWAEKFYHMEEEVTQAISVHYPDILLLFG